MKKTIKARVLELLEDGSVLTAMEAAHRTKSKWSTTSSLLYKLMQKGVVDRIPNYGPLKGYGYFLCSRRKMIGRVVLERPSNPYTEFPCTRCGEDRNGYENHHCPVPGYIMPSGDEEERFCETCGARMIVPGKSGTTECSRCLE